MTRSVEIPEEAVNAAELAAQAAYQGGDVNGRNHQMRAALTAALPHLVPAGAVKISDEAVEAAHSAFLVSTARGYREVFREVLEAAAPYLEPADGGLREALNELAKERDSANGSVPGDYVIRPYELLELLAEYPAAPAVPQPVDREALRERIARTLHDMDHMHTWERCDDACGTAAYQRADGVLALLDGSQVKS